MKNNGPDSYVREDECAHEFWLAALFLAGLICVIFYSLVTILNPLALILLGVAMAAIVMFVGLRFENRLNGGISFVLAIVFCLGITLMWSGYLKGISAEQAYSLIRAN